MPQEPPRPEPQRAQIGSKLQNARLKKTSSLATAAQQTRIPRKFLEALEQNRFEEFPAQVYLRAFLKAYCDYLEIAFDPLWKEIFPKMPPAPIPLSKKPSPPKSRPSLWRYVHETAPAAAWLKIFNSPTALLTLALLLAILLALGLKYHRPRPQAWDYLGPPTALESIPLKEAKLLIEFSNAVWLKLLIDDSPQFEGLVPRGSKQEWKAHKSILLRTSNPHALRLWLNGTAYQLPTPDIRGDYRIESR